MRCGGKAGLMLATAWLLAASGAMAADAVKYLSWEGKWKLNLAETHYPAGLAITGNDIDVTKDDGATLRYTETVTMNGAPMTQTFEGTYGGEPKAIGPGQNLAFHHISEDTYGAVRTNDKGQIMERSACNIAADLKKMTCRVFAYGAGQPKMFVEVFDKAQ